jgi:hypothetical protein
VASCTHAPSYHEYLTLGVRSVAAQTGGRIHVEACASLFILPCRLGDVFEGDKGYEVTGRKLHEVSPREPVGGEAVQLNAVEPREQVGSETIRRFEYQFLQAA